MLKIYKKTTKSNNNMYGFIEIKDIKDINNPFLLCISNDLNSSKSIFGLMRDGAHAARIHTTQECAANYNIDKVPIDFIGIRYIKKRKSVEKELVDTLLYPYLIKNGKDINSLKKQARNINVLTFDQGTNIYLKAEKQLVSKLKELDLKTKEIEEILKQTTLVSLGSNENLEKTYSTTVSFIDTNDNKCTTEELLELKKVMEEKNINRMFFPVGKKNTILYPFISTGEHSPKKYLETYSPAKSAISSTISNNLHNSLYNLNNDTFYEVSIDENINQLYFYGSDLCEGEEALKLLDSNLNYMNSTKYTEEEAKLRYDLDQAYKLIIKQNLMIDSYKKDIIEKNNQFKNITDNIKKALNKEQIIEILKK